MFNFYNSNILETPVLWPFSWDYPAQAVLEEIFFWTFMVQGKTTEADTLIIQLGATPSGLITDPPLSFHFYAGCPSCHNIPLCTGLVGQAPNMLACITSGMVYYLRTTGRLYILLKHVQFALHI